MAKECALRYIHSPVLRHKRIFQCVAVGSVLCCVSEVMLLFCCQDNLWFLRCVSCLTVAAIRNKKDTGGDALWCGLV